MTKFLANRQIATFIVRGTLDSVVYLTRDLEKEKERKRKRIDATIQTRKKNRNI